MITGVDPIGDGSYTGLNYCSPNVSRPLGEEMSGREKQNGTHKRNQYPGGVCLGNGRNSRIAILTASLLMFVIVTSSVVAFIVVTVGKR